VGLLRIRAIAAMSPVVQDVVVAGHDRDEVRLLLFPNRAACLSVCPAIPTDAPLSQLLSNVAVREKVRRGLEAIRSECEGSSTFAVAAVFLHDPPSIDSGEITDKGYINQSAVLRLRADIVAALYSTSTPEVIMID
jgi:feruloyl-CoA synthase